MPVHAGKRLNYHVLLRGLGAWLDEEQPSRFSALETPDGFTLVLTGPGDVNARRDVRLSYEALLEKEAALVHNRRTDEWESDAPSVYTGSWALAPTGHQDILRAIGYELDDAKADSIILDELQEGLLLTYSYLNPSEGISWRKQIIQLTPEQLEKIRQVAVSRRRLTKRRGWRNRLGL